MINQITNKKNKKIGISLLPTEYIITRTKTKKRISRTPVGKKEMLQKFDNIEKNIYNVKEPKGR